MAFTSNWKRRFLLRKFEIKKPRDYPEELKGILINSPYLHLYDEEEQDLYLNKAKSLGASRVRVFLDDAYEPKIGEYRGEVLERVLKLSQKATTKGLAIEVDLFDCFTLGNSLINNFSYPTPVSLPTSPYNKTRDKLGYFKFFVDEDLKDAFKFRVKDVVSKLKGTSVNIVSCANEANPALWSLPENEAKDVLTKWYQEVVEVIRVENPDLIVLTGLAEPWSVDSKKIPGISANTLHAYPFSTNLKRLESFNENIPLVCQETGFPYRFLLRIPSEVRNYLSLSFARKLILSLMLVDEGKKEIHPKVLSIGIWKLGKHDDGFNVSSDDPFWSYI